MSCRASRERYFDSCTFLIAGGEAVLADRAENHDEKTRATTTAQTAMRTKADRSRGYDARQDIAIPSPSHHHHHDPSCAPLRLLRGDL